MTGHTSDPDVPFDQDRPFDQDGPFDQDRPGTAPNTASSTDPIEVVRSEERLGVAYRTVPVERVRIRRVVVEEERTITVRLRREELVVEREPIEGHERAGIDTGASYAPHTFVLHAEEPVITTRIVPVERVHVLKDVITEMQIVTDDVRKERVELVRSEIEGDLL